MPSRESDRTRSPSSPTTRYGCRRRAQWPRARHSTKGPCGVRSDRPGREALERPVSSFAVHHEEFWQPLDRTSRGCYQPMDSRLPQRVMTGAQLCRRLLAQSGVEAVVRCSLVNQYRPGIIELRSDCFNGRGAVAHTLAAHEMGHAEQGRAFGAAMAVRCTMPGRLYLEWDASRRARRMLRANGIAPHEETLRASWRSYLGPALFQAAALLAAVLFVFGGKK